MSHHADGPYGPDPGRDQARPPHVRPSQPPPPHGRAQRDRSSREHRAHDRPPYGTPPPDPRVHPYPPGRPYAAPGWRPTYPVPPIQHPLPQPVQVPGGEGPQGILWASVPFLTFGFGTPFSFLYAALRRGSGKLGVTAAGYGVAVTGVMALFSTDSAAAIALGSLLTLMLWLAGTAHTFAVRSAVFPREVPRNRLNRQAVEVARYRRTLREEARALAAEDPALAHELRIGRPDVPRTYDDGGLVDVNHAPKEIIAALPGMDDEMAERVVRRREAQGAFVSAEEMAVDADLPPDLVPQLSEYSIFLR
ncbi:helix-hairpin-helix domain-containing protein [Actinomadura graeca]|uniref:Helix-hairpin-helix domain-containing protein n=1 Tax=Actinomadura graeca TaxID=2750812 RepID=A0ABX8QXM8_9ACTN|nr:helix-hairpin-helix domain-containing protein [Actinomadura graeca]QXJ23605.1 helix-hairpin-helix domain-containing protein [Actinomadura graeca]